LNPHRNSLNRRRNGLILSFSRKCHRRADGRDQADFDRTIAPYLSAAEELVTMRTTR
jgi:hypothetical protein